VAAEIFRSLRPRRVEGEGLFIRFAGVRQKLYISLFSSSPLLVSASVPQHVSPRFHRNRMGNADARHPWRSGHAGGVLASETGGPVIQFSKYVLSRAIAKAGAIALMDCGDLSPL